MDEEGWLHSGDIALIDECGRIKIIDRVKNLLKLSQGEYVALEKVENVYSLSPLIAQILVHGEGLRDHLVAVVVPDPEKLCALAAHTTGQHISPSDGQGLAKLTKDPKIIKAAMEELEKYAAKAKLQGFERIKNLALILEPFTAENDMLTPTMKIKRNIAQQKLKPLLDQLYDDTPVKLMKL